MTHLISAAELAREIDDVVVLDVRWALTTAHTSAGRDDYAAGHVPGAFFVDLDTELAAPPGAGGRHPLPDPLVVQAVLRRAGITPTSRVVAYDGQESYAAARAWWVLRWLGIPDVRVLDGGYAAWLAAGLPVSAETPADRDGDVEVRPGEVPALDADGAARLAREGLLLDARAPERYAGETEPIDPVAGHIPGAVNSPTTAWLMPDGTFRRDLAQHWAAVQGGRTGEVGVYCGSGVTAAHHLLALAELGVDAALYPGSWSEWIRDPSRPVATGPQSG
ncbi:thiosulfate/3-mercaptopyruvate sulfurtransferase [Humibacillus xanthopallidus]|uniref:Sulfurtransferase n=1 Tax=Humibacillus xanthopallidus TaxID=412689 RepID=A0A543PTJ3_9MICO|nr:sulfurtransferase [Humibacillus xanthopallidus]TQN47391.1 thiosulfate/3-mercaptopyruvate sulfurtransferase [Humibacillus xanthopallidus]